ncbi:hypothetical protein SLEP1_g35441 [Rubroshorea leprosula]|uniref:Ionotropic glutamate receptor C-terminal domain-containing protein n=1 Tax=Rubroshorea leprosula TaxID=152421 RepID=A0AAV5KN95_9ROSI|nr:hypothetical protein SLEP1_g35441 [Rubroshorea leprosula]
MEMIPTNLLFCISSLFFVLFCRLLSVEATVAQNTMASATIPVNVGVVLDLDTWIGKLGLSCINMAISDFYFNHSNYRTRLVLNVKDSEGEIVGAAAAALDLIKNVQVQAVIGPSDSMQANFMIALGNKSQVPIISFSATSPFLISSMRSPYFFRATHNDSSQVKAISAIVQTFRWREAVPIYVDNEFGEGVIPYLSDALEEVNARIPYRSVISPRATDEEIEKELFKLMSMQSRVFIVHMTPDLGSRVFDKATEIGMMTLDLIENVQVQAVIGPSNSMQANFMIALGNKSQVPIISFSATSPFLISSMRNLGSRVFDKATEIGMMSEGYVWIITDGMTNLWSLIHHSDHMDSMQGVLGVRNYVPKSKELENFKVRWKSKFVQDNPSMLNAELDNFGLWANDATFALAMAVEEVLGTVKFNFDASNLESFGRISQNGPKLIEALSNMRFKGISGEFGFVNGQLESPIFQIFNVNGNGEKGIGFWTSKDGLVKRLNSTPNANLGTIRWPGDSYSIPKGWEIPMNGRKLKIGVPVVRKGFEEFVKVMPYPVPYQFYPIQMEKDESVNDIIDQVFFGKYDAVVGDITIVANRSLYVDFTLPFMESTVVIVVPIRNNTNKNTWVFLKPLSSDLWITSFCFFVFMAFVVWVLEHRINEDFRGPPLHHVGTSFWFSFSTITFAHRERVLSNPARIVVVIWCIVVFILTQSYTANLTSLLTVQQLQPAVTDINELLKNGENVGYPHHSFIEEIVQRLTFDRSKMKKFTSLEVLHELFTNGSIAAAIDEIPYMNLFLTNKSHCNKYTTLTEPTFKTDGFGFVFPRGSPLVADVSRAILNVTESFRIGDIQNAWKKQTNCPDSSTLDSTNSLSLGSFWGLFLVAGLTGVLALVYSAAEFLYEQRDVLRKCDPRISIWNRILQVLRNFDHRDLTSHTFGQRGLREEDSNIEIIPVRGAVEHPVEIHVEAPVEIPVEAPVENPDDKSGAATSEEIEIHHASTNSS